MARLAARWFMITSMSALLFMTAAPSNAKETKLKSEVIAAESINPNRRGSAQPVKMHIYYLKHDEAFMLANFGDLTDVDSPVLADDLVRRAEILIGPGEMLELDEAFDEAAQFIGVVAEFTAIEQAAWRAVVAVPARRWRDVLRLFQNSKLQILLDGTTVSAEIIED